MISNQSFLYVFASDAKQSSIIMAGDCFVAKLLAMTRSREILVVEDT